MRRHAPFDPLAPPRLLDCGSCPADDGARGGCFVAVGPRPEPIQHHQPRCLGGQSGRAGWQTAGLTCVGWGLGATKYAGTPQSTPHRPGKTAFIRNSTPPFAGESVRLWYGRWDYKYLTAAAHGAAGALVIHTTQSAGYPWQVLSASADSTRIDLPPGAEHRMQFQGWVTDEGAKKVAGLANLDLDKLRTDAQQKSFRPVPMGVRTSFEMPIERKVTPSANVVGLLPGTDPQLKNEAVVFTAHWDQDR